MIGGCILGRSLTMGITYIEATVTGPTGKAEQG